jgi:lysophospholipase L1-like esterase
MSIKFTMRNISVNRFFQSLQHLFRALPVLTIVLLTFSFFSFCYAEPTDSSTSAEKWVGTWSTAPQLVETGNNPPDPGLSNNTLRQIVHASLGGDTLRMRFSNEFSTSPVTLNEVHIAVSLGGGMIDSTTEKVLLFNGNTNFTMAPGAAIISDPFQFTLQPLTDVAITIYFGATSPDVTGHPGSRTTSYILTGNQVSKVDFSGAVQTDHWYVINTIDVKAPDSSYAVAILGNSITDGRGSGTNKQNRWPDELARRLQENSATQQVAILNEGIGGNCVLGNCLGPSALSRFNRDVIGQSGVKWLIILEGINDIGYGAPGTGNNLINAFTQMIQTAHANDIFVYGATLLPMKGSSYFTTQHETEREIVNEWIRTSSLLDGVIDMDKALRNPADTLSLLPINDSGDHLHPSETGHHMMAEAVDLSLFVGKDTSVQVNNSQTIYFEPECATVGENWDILTDSQASNGRYVTVKTGIQSLNSAPTDSTGYIIIPFTVDTASNYSVFARLNDPTYDDDSYWVKMDDGAFEMDNGLVTSGWEWLKFNDYTLTAGEHSLTIAYREDGAELDKICITNSGIPPVGMGEDAENICEPDTTTVGVNLIETISDYALFQNYPNPFNPSTEILYNLPHESFVTLKVYDVLGREISTLVNEEKPAGIYRINFNAAGLGSGVYYYKLRAGNFIKTKKMILIR